jgi:hypothetical protein
MVVIGSEAGLERSSFSCPSDAATQASCSPLHSRAGFPGRKEHTYWNKCWLSRILTKDEARSPAIEGVLAGSAGERDHTRSHARMCEAGRSPRAKIFPCAMCETDVCVAWCGGGGRGVLPGR